MVRILVKGELEMPRTARNIYKRKDGRWEGRYKLETGGPAKYKSVYAPTYAEVKKLLEEKKNPGTLKPGKPFSEYLDFWLQDISFQKKDSTMIKYEGLVLNHIKPALGNYSVKFIDSEVINSFIKSKLQEGFSPSYVKTMELIISGTLNLSVKLGARPPLSEKPKTIRSGKKEISFFSVDVRNYLNKRLSLDESKTALAMLIALNTGMRIGEVCALKWDDINLEEEMINVRRTLTKKKAPFDPAKTIWVDDIPKTPCSIRSIPIVPILLTRLMSEKPSAASSYVISDNAAFVSERTLENRFHKKLDEYNIRQINFHGLRHTFATCCIEKGVDIKTLSEILGHSNVSITLNIYVHSTVEFKKLQLNKLND